MSADNLTHAPILVEGIRRYPENISKYLTHSDAQVAHYARQCQESLPRAIFELAFLTGQKSWLEYALEMEPTLTPEQETELVLFAKSGKSTSYRSITFEKPPGQVAWQLWRQASIMSGEFHQERFAGYNQCQFINASATGGRVLANFYSQQGKKMKYRFNLQGEEKEFFATVKTRCDLPPSSRFRFDYDVLFSEPLPSELANIIFRTIGPSYWIQRG